MTDHIRLLICDDHQLLTDAMSIVIDRDDMVELVAPAVSDPAMAVDMVREHRPDIVLMDIIFEGRTMSGIDATRAIKEVAPDTKVVIVTGQVDERLLVEAVEAGAAGFLGKNEAVTQVLDEVRRAAAGETLIDPAILARVLHEVARQRGQEESATRLLAELTPRELEVLESLAVGGRNDDIAAEMHISSQTLQTHVHNILVKLDVHSKLEAVIFAVKNGAIEV